MMNTRKKPLRTITITEIGLVFTPLDRHSFTVSAGVELVGRESESKDVLEPKSKNNKNEMKRLR